MTQAAALRRFVLSKVGQTSQWGAYFRGLAGLGATPDVLIIGAMKCGTTSLFDYLSQHPQVGRTMKKEVHYFDRYFDRGGHWYRGQFRKRPGQISLEATPYYLFHPLVPARAAALVPGAKLIVLMREPVARAYSHYHHWRALGRESLSFEDAIAAEAERLGEFEKALASGRLQWSEAHGLYSYFARGLYARQIEHWQQHYPADRFLFLRAEDLFAAPQKTFDQVCEFLGLPSVPLTDQQGQNRRSYEPIGEGIRARLAKLYEDPNQRLEKMTGIRWP